MSSAFVCMHIQSTRKSEIFKPLALAHQLDSGLLGNTEDRFSHLSIVITIITGEEVHVSIHIKVLYGNTFLSFYLLYGNFRNKIFLQVFFYTGLAYQINMI